MRRLYEASRLYINFFQLSFKLKSKWREGARVHKQYYPPETPYWKLLMRDDVPTERKQALKRQMESLDPVLLLKHIGAGYGDGVEPKQGSSAYLVMGIEAYASGLLRSFS